MKKLQLNMWWWKHEIFISWGSRYIL